MKPYQQQQLPITAAGLSHLTTMESLALPQELYWDGKSEPNSPPGNELFTIATDLAENENWLYDDNFANETLILSDENLELKPGVEILFNLIDGDEYVVELDSLKEENWPPQTAGIINPIAAYSELDSLVAPSAPQQNFFTKPFDEALYHDNIQSAGTLTTLTPPQSPPRNGNLLALQEPQQHVHAPIQFHTLHYRPTAAAAVPVAQVATPATNTYIVPQSVSTELQSNNDSNANDAAQFTDNAAAAAAFKVKNEYEHAQIIDQIVQEFAKDLPDLSDEYESQYTRSPASQIEESSIDEEWTPTSSAGSSPARYSGSSSSSCSGDDEKLVDASPAKKRRPYGRGVEDRKIRKKEQNKNAATRYRQKKKLEMELVLTEEQKLAQRNEELKGKLDKFEREVKYLKGLIREFYRKKKSG